MKYVFGIILFVLGILGAFLSANSIKFAGLGFIVTFVIWVFSLTAISGWWVLGIPILMFAGGLLGMLLNIVAVAIGSYLLEN